MNTFFLKIISSDKVFYEGKCQNLILPMEDGQFSILAHHENMVVAVDHGGCVPGICGNHQQSCLRACKFGGAAGGDRCEARGGGEGESPGASAPEAEHPGVLPLPGISGPRHDPPENIKRQTLEYLMAMSHAEAEKKEMPNTDCASTERCLASLFYAVP